MIADVRLGLRLARGGEAGGRLRGAAHVVAQLVGSWVMLTTLAIIRAELDHPSYPRGELGLLVLTVVATIGVPVVVLVATAGRLSAMLRDRRLAGLRVLGLSRSRTRLVAAVEAGAGGVVGCVLGFMAFWITRPLISDLRVGGRDWSWSSFTPWPLAAALVVIGLPLVAVVVGLVPEARASTVPRAPVAASRQPGLWRLAVLPAGLVAVAVSATGASDDIDMIWFYLLVAGGVLSAIGLVLVVPVITRLIADIMVRVPGRPAVRIAGRRLQSQPAGVSRIIAGLLIGLFVVAGGRMVVGAWEDTPQYRSTARATTEGPAGYSVSIDGDRVEETAAALAATDGVLGAFVNRTVMSTCGEDDHCLSGFVGTCADLESAVPDAVGCRDDRVAWLDARYPEAVGSGGTMLWEATDDPPRPSARAPMPRPDDVITSATAEYGVRDTMQAQVFIPVDTPGLVQVADAGRADSTQEIFLAVDPRSLSDAQVAHAVRAIDPGADAFPKFDRVEYDFVGGLRALVWAVAAVVLAIGLLGFAIATVDRSVSRRAEMVSLQLVGTPRRVIRTAQWFEAALPLFVGIVLTIAAGTAVGAAYLVLGQSYDASPWGSVLALGAVSLAGAVGIAGLTVVACAPRIRAELIRRA